jgi:G:T/U-mismatch repair DNA glycosylase
MSDELEALRARISQIETREVCFEQRDGAWLIARLRISSTWGWVLPQEAPPFLAEHLGAGTLRGGRPVVYQPFE